MWSTTNPIFDWLFVGGAALVTIVAVVFGFAMLSVVRGARTRATAEITDDAASTRSALAAGEPWEPDPVLWDGVPADDRAELDDD